MGGNTEINKGVPPALFNFVVKPENGFSRLLIYQNTLKAGLHDLTHTPIGIKKMLRNGKCDQAGTCAVPQGAPFTRPLKGGNSRPPP